MDQATGLTQAFISGALWSPFYGSMAVAFTFAPQASLTILVSMGLPVALCGILITWLTLSSKRHGYAADFAGYPLHLEALLVPGLLAIAVLVAHEIKPAWSVLATMAHRWSPRLRPLRQAHRRAASPATLTLTCRTLVVHASRSQRWPR